MTYRKVTTLQPINIKLPILKSRKSINHCLIVTDSNGDVFKFNKYGVISVINIKPTSTAMRKTE